jgi:hypothetical protein
MEIGWRSDPSNPIFLKKGSRVCRADGSMMISAIVSSDPHFLAQDKDCETVDGEMEVQAIDRCAGVAGRLQLISTASGKVCGRVHHLGRCAKNNYHGFSTDAAAARDRSPDTMGGKIELAKLMDSRGRSVINAPYLPPLWEWNFAAFPRN